MKLIHKDIKKGIIKISIDNKNDLWYLSTIIDKGDFVKGKTIRKIKIGEGKESKIKIVKKPVFLKISIEKIDYSPEVLRIGGNITDGPEDVSRGSHHSFSLKEGKEITIIKEKWLKFQIDKIEEACEEASAPIVLCVFDREEAFFAKLVKKGYEPLSAMKGDVAKKGDETIKGTNFYAKIISQLKDYLERFKSSHAIVASPSFWKDEMMKELKDDSLKKKIILATVSSVGKTSFNELIKRDEVKSALKSERFAKEMNLVENIMAGISKGGLAAYGIDEVKNAVDSGAVSTLIVSDNLIKKSRKEDKYEAIEKMLKSVESMDGEVFIVSSEHEGGKKLDGIGGIGALLRYRISY